MKALCLSFVLIDIPVSPMTDTDSMIMSMNPKGYLQPYLTGVKLFTSEKLLYLGLILYHHDLNLRYWYS